MAGKRQAGKELNHDNWNDDEEEEEPGQFKKASSDVLEQRVKKIAKRRNAGGSDDGNKPANPFSGFGGFNSSTSAGFAVNPTPFSFLAKLPAASSTTSTTTGNTVKTNGEVKSSDDDNKVNYLSKVKALNIAFFGWIKLHIDQDALCDLTPVFKDYEKYMKDFESLKNRPAVIEVHKNSETANTFTFGKPAASISQPLQPSPTTTTGGGPTFSMNQPFSFGLQKASTSPFSFANVTQKSETAQPDEKGTEEDSEEPPKNEFTPVVEKDSLYTKRCKVFVKNANNYADRGVGMLFLKKVDEKVQLLVRADTNLGNIILNIIVSEGLPVSRMGKNNVMVVCVPTPESKPPPVPVLLRVKTGEEADELLVTINKYKN